MTDILSHMEYHLEGEVSDAALVAASAAIDDWAAARPGFRYRCVARRDDGQVIDLLFWADRASKDAADADFVPSGCGAALLPMMVEGSFKVVVAPVLSSRMCGCDVAEAASAAA